MRKWFSLCLILTVLLCACGKTQPEATQTTPQTVQTAAPTQESEQTPTQPEEATTQVATEPAEAAITPLLYEVTDGDGHKIWLFGSIHVGRENFYPLPDYVMTAFDQAEALAVEFDVRAFEKDLPAQIAAVKAMLYTDGTTIKDHISEELYNRAVAILQESGQYVSMLDYYMPVLWSSFVDNALLEADASDFGVDVNLIDMAYDAQKPVLSIESAESQYGMLAGFSPELQVLLLENAVATYEDGSAATQTEMLLDTWAEGNVYKFNILLAPADAFETEEEAALYAGYEEEMITRRDNFMAQYCKEALAEGKQLFVCVGAAHIMGSKAVRAQLEEAGYTVTCLTPGK